MLERLEYNAKYPIYTWTQSHKQVTGDSSRPLSNIRSCNTLKTYHFLARFVLGGTIIHYRLASLSVYLKQGDEVTLNDY